VIAKPRGAAEPTNASPIEWNRLNRILPLQAAKENRRCPEGNRHDGTPAAIDQDSRPCPDGRPMCRIRLYKDAESSVEGCRRLPQTSAASARNDAGSGGAGVVEVGSASLVAVRSCRSSGAPGTTSARDLSAAAHYRTYPGTAPSISARHSRPARARVPDRYCGKWNTPGAMTVLFRSVTRHCSRAHRTLLSVSKELIDFGAGNA